jgi:hypothetical protein
MGERDKTGAPKKCMLIPFLLLCFYIIYFYGSLAKKVKYFVSPLASMGMATSSPNYLIKKIIIIIVQAYTLNALRKIV